MNKADEEYAKRKKGAAICIFFALLSCSGGVIIGSTDINWLGAVFITIGILGVIWTLFFYVPKDEIISIDEMD